MKPFVVHQLIDCNGASHNYVAFNLDTEFSNLLNFIVYHFFLRQTEFRNPVYQNASRLVQRLKNGYITTGFRQIGGTSQSGRPGPDYGHFLPVGFYIFNRCVFVLACPVGHVSFQFSYGNRFVLDAHDTGSFTLRLLRADASANGRQGRIFPNNGRRPGHISVKNGFYELRYLNIDRTGSHTSGILALNATIRFQ